MSATRIAPLTFHILASRLVRNLDGLIRSGATTERRLAGLVGISQPHLHNILNGTRTLTPAVADMVICRLEWSLLDLLEAGDAEAWASRRHSSTTSGRPVALLSLGVGPGTQFPGIPLDDITIPHSILAACSEPVVVSAVFDQDMAGIIDDGDLVLVDRSAAVRMKPDHDAMYILRMGEESRLRWIRYSVKGLFVISASTWHEPLRWTQHVSPASRRHDIVEARVIAVAQRLDRTFRPPVRPFAAN